MQVFVCSDIEHMWALAVCAAQQEEYELSLDQEIEAELGVWPERDGHYEEVEVERVPIDWGEAP